MNIDFKTLEVIGFTVSDTVPVKVKILLNEDRFISARIMDFSEVNENAYQYFNDVNYYHGEIMDMIDEYINEATDYKIEKEASEFESVNLPQKTRKTV